VIEPTHARLTPALKAATDDLPLAVAYYLNGANFRASAEKLRDGLDLDELGRPKTLLAVPFYFLASHATELFIKAALLKRGFDPSALKAFDYRHNLAALLEELVKMNVPVTSATAAVIQGLSEQHRTHQLRYTVLVDDGQTTYWPPLAHVFAALDEMILLTRISTHGV
jgi:hypothetical protein